MPTAVPTSPAPCATCRRLFWAVIASLLMIPLLGFAAASAEAYETRQIADEIVFDS